MKKPPPFSEDVVRLLQEIGSVSDKPELDAFACECEELAARDDGATEDELAALADALREAYEYVNSLDN